MYNKGYEQRLKKIHATLIAFASGNLSARIPSSDLQDDIEVMIANLNMTLEKVSSFFYHRGFANHSETYDYRVQSYFLLDFKGNIIAHSPALKELFTSDGCELTGKVFTDFLLAASKREWTGFKSVLLEKNNPINGFFIELSFKAMNKSVYVMNCLIDKVQPSNYITVSAIEIEKGSDKTIRELNNKVIAGRHTTKPEAVLALPKKYQTNLNAVDIENINKAHDHILKHINKPLPPIKALAKQFNLSENRLKAGFMQVYGQLPNSLYNKYNLKHRLEEAYHLVKCTAMPLATIAVSSGFNFISNFTTAFKLEFKQSPSDVRYNKSKQKKKKGDKNA